MAATIAKTNAENPIAGSVWRGIAVAAGFALLTYGHTVLSNTWVFAFYAALCLLAVAIAFYLVPTRVLAVSHSVGSLATERAAESDSNKLKKLSSELAQLEREYRIDITRLDRKWL